MYFFHNCKPTYGFTKITPKETKNTKSLSGSAGGLCNEERSLISPDYARAFICDFILGKEQEETILTLF